MPGTGTAGRSRNAVAGGRGGGRRAGKGHGVVGRRRQFEGLVGMGEMEPGTGSRSWEQELEARTG